VGVTDELAWLGPRGRDGGIDTVPLPGFAGAISLCGKHAIGPDHEAALERCGATTVVCLVEPHELLDRYPAYVGWLREHDGGRAVWFPIHDLHAPDVDVAVGLLAQLADRVRAGEHLLIHCAAGIGRAGTIATCLLITLGMGQTESLELVAAHRPMAGPEVGAQRDLVDAIWDRHQQG
jgi:protein-tyrosine phosphatase